MILFYSVLVANNKDTFTYSFDEFLDILDECEDNMVQIYTDFVTEGIVEEKVEVPTAKKKVKPQLK